MTNAAGQRSDAVRPQGVTGSLPCPDAHTSAPPPKTAAELKMDTSTSVLPSVSVGNAIGYMQW